MREEYILAHRDLQLARSYWSGSQKYMGKRRAKLEESKRIVARLQEKLDKLEQRALGGYALRSN